MFVRRIVIEEENTLIEFDSQNNVNNVNNVNIGNNDNNKNVNNGKSGNNRNNLNIRSSLSPGDHELDQIIANYDMDSIYAPKQARNSAMATKSKTSNVSEIPQIDVINAQSRNSNNKNNNNNNNRNSSNNTSNTNANKNNINNKESNDIDINAGTQASPLMQFDSMERNSKLSQGSNYSELTNITSPYSEPVAADEIPKS